MHFTSACIRLNWGLDGWIPEPFRLTLCSALFCSFSKLQEVPDRCQLSLLLLLLVSGCIIAWKRPWLAWDFTESFCSVLYLSSWQQEGSRFIRWSLIWEWNAENTWESLVYPCWRKRSLGFFGFRWRYIFSEIWNWEMFFSNGYQKKVVFFLKLFFIFLVFSYKQAPDKVDHRMQNNH